MKPLVDVFIAGAGPAGAALAIALSDLAPGLRVVLADTGRDEPFRIGESVPPQIKPLLDHLGLGEAFAGDGHYPTFRTVSAWGDPDLLSNEFFLHAYNTGWRLDRERFDCMLAVEAKRRGATLLEANVGALSYDAPYWNVECRGQLSFTSRIVVDATGRSAVLSRLQGIKPVKLDRLVACAVFFGHDDNADTPRSDAALVESTSEGWWYTVTVPGGRRIVMLMTDTDIARRLRASRLDAWLALLAQTRHVYPLVATFRPPLSPPRLWAAASQYCHAAWPPSMLAVGDALSCFDPLSSQGIIKALRSAIFASYAIADLLRGDDRGLGRYSALMKREFASYRQTWREYYRREQRWPEMPFWKRRHHAFLESDIDTAPEQ